MSKAHMPNGSTHKESAAWGLIAVSIILFIMIGYRFVVYKFSNFGGLPNPLTGNAGFLRNLMKEDSFAHTLLYVVLFALVFNATLSFFID